MNARTWLILSLAVNALAVPAALFAWSRARPAVPPPVTAAAPAPAAPTPVPDEPAPTPAAPDAPAIPAARTFDWQQVESTDYHRYIANLRAIGCPEETIRDIIVADVNKLFAERAKQLRPAPRRFEYWRTGRNVFAQALADPEELKRRQALHQEKRALLKELLGVDIAEDPREMFAGVLNPFDAMLDFLPAEKRARLLEIEQEFSARQAKMFIGGHMDEEDVRLLQESNREKREAIRAMMSPEEFADYELRMSDTAMQMRHSLNGFEPSEEEFLRIFELRRGFDDAFGPPWGGDPEQMGARNAAQTQLNGQLRELLGEERYADYVRVQDHSWQALSKVAERQGLDEAGARELWDMKREAETQAGRIRADPSLNDAQRTAALEAIRQETERTFAARLGDRGMTSLRNGSGGFWLNNLSSTAHGLPPGVFPAEP